MCKNNSHPVLLIQAKFESNYPVLWMMRAKYFGQNEIASITTLVEFINKEF
jgi:hypothetical protein